MSYATLLFFWRVERGYVCVIKRRGIFHSRYVKALPQPVLLQCTSSLDWWKKFPYSPIGRHANAARESVVFWAFFDLLGWRSSVQFSGAQTGSRSVRWLNGLWFSRSMTCWMRENEITLSRTVSQLPAIIVLSLCSQFICTVYPSWTLHHHPSHNAGATKCRLEMPKSPGRLFIPVWEQRN